MIHCIIAAPKTVKSGTEPANTQPSSMNATNFPSDSSHIPSLSLDKPTLGETFQILYPVAYKWDDIGAFLGISSNQLSTIKCNNDRVQACLREMITLWLNRVTIPPTWVSLADAMSVIDEKTASKIIQTYKS